MINFENFTLKWSFLENRKVFIACSGGVDSMVLIHLLKQVCKNITVLHVNYHLRGKASGLDEEFVKDFCEKEKISFQSHSIDMNDYLKINKGNLQEEARKIRYSWFQRFLKEDEVYLALGHHFDDQIETFFQNIARKSGTMGLACMLNKNGKIIRPLLAYTKEEIIDFANKNNVIWREDDSNTSNKYTRNRLRNEFLPFLKEKVPNLNKSVALLIKVFQENQAETEFVIAPIYREIQKTKKITFKDWQKCSKEEKIHLLKLLNIKHSQLIEIEKLWKTQKGKLIETQDFDLVREDEYLSLIDKTSEIYIPQLKIEKVDSLPTVFSKNELYLDASKIKGELKIRPWKKGDRMKPIGIKGSKLISDIITDEKIENSKREHVFVVHDEVNIHWCVGLKVGRMAIVLKESLEIIKISVV
jgi:tRNA(Ile)-lysidine synthase